MARLFRRVYRVQVGTLATEDVDVTFKVTRTLAAHPGTCEITLYNLSEAHRRELRPNAFGRLRVFCQLDAGYEGSRSMAISTQPGMPLSRSSRRRPSRSASVNSALPSSGTGSESVDMASSPAA